MVKVYFLQSEKQDATNITALSKYILASGHGGKQTATQLPCVHKTIMLLCFYLFDFGTFCGAEHFGTFCCAKIDFCIKCIFASNTFLHSKMLTPWYSKPYRGGGPGSRKCIKNKEAIRTKLTFYFINCSIINLKFYKRWLVFNQFTASI